MTMSRLLMGAAMLGLTLVPADALALWPESSRKIEEGTPPRDGERGAKPRTQSHHAHGVIDRSSA